MKDLLLRVRRIDGVSGIMLYEGNRVVESLVQEGLNPGTVEAVGRLLDRTETGGDVTGISPRKMTFYLNNLILVAAHMRENVTLTVVCERSINLPLLDVSLEKVISEIEKIRSEGKGKKVAVEDILHGPLAFPLERIQDLLSEYIGPVAGITLRESVEKLAIQGPVKAATLPILIKMLAEEVEPKDRGDFLSRAKAVLDKMI